VRFKGTPPWVIRAWTSVSSASALSKAIGFLIRIFGTYHPRLRSCFKLWSQEFWRKLSGTQRNVYVRF
jgi:hypothetical protein